MERPLHVLSHVFNLPGVCKDETTRYAGRGILRLIWFIMYILFATNDEKGYKQVLNETLWSQILFYVMVVLAAIKDMFEMRVYMKLKNTDGGADHVANIKNQ